MIDSSMLTYGRQEAIFQLHEDNADLLINSNNELEIPASLAPGMALKYQQDNELVDLNVKSELSRNTTELATLYKQVFGSFNTSFNSSFDV